MFLRSQGSNIWVWVERGRQAFSEILLRKRVPPKSRIPNDAQKQQHSQQSVSDKVQNHVIGKQNHRISGSILARFRNLNTQAANLRRSAVTRTSGKQHFVGFAFLGIALANEGQRVHQQEINLMPLDVCCEVIQVHSRTCERSE